MSVNAVKPIVIAHRGASLKAPENTLASIKLAWALNVDAVEIDVHSSHDSELMVIHDHSTGRTSDKNLVVAESLSGELRKLDAGSWKSKTYSGEKIPFLDEVLETIPENKTLLIEIKSGIETLKQVIDRISNRDIEKKILIQSFDAETVFNSKEILPEVPAFLLLESMTDIDSMIKTIKDNRLDGLSVKHILLKQDLVTKCRDEGLQIFTWTVDSKAEAERVASLGVDGIITNSPDEIMQTLSDLP